jgi:mannose-6-phosphate isomerase-like protein (cupin superfamily)
LHRTKENPTRGKERERVIENPVIGDRVTFLKTAEETNGEYMLAKVELAPNGGNAMHYHLAFTEAFEVLEGRLNVDLDGRHLVLGPGEKALVPKRIPHRFYSTSDEPVTFTVEMRPARRMEDALRVAYGLARDGRPTPGRSPKTSISSPSCSRWARATWRARLSSCRGPCSAPSLRSPGGRA